MNHAGLKRAYPLGVFRDGEHVAIIGREKYGSTWRLTYGQASQSHFKMQPSAPSLVLPLGRQAAIGSIADVKVSTVLGRRMMTYTDTASDQQLRIATHDPSDDMNIWEVAAADARLVGSGHIVPEYTNGGQYVLYYGQRDIRVAFSRNANTWHAGSLVLAAGRSNYFDHHGMKVLATSYTKSGIFIVYESRETKDKDTLLHIGAMMCSASAPDEVIWQSDEPLYTHTSNTAKSARTLGAVIYESILNIYIATTQEKVIIIKLPNPFAPATVASQETARLQLHRFPQNPILSPGVYEWESQAVFNPAAFLDAGRVHLLYRAMGNDGISRIGYASSSDGVNFDERLDYPVYTPIQGFGLPVPGTVQEGWRYDPQAYPSGGGWAGSEDPRVIVADGRAYMTFLAFNGWDFMRMALTSISLEHLADKKWHWKDPVLISAPSQTHKNWVIFPERINGQYAVLHGLSPKIHIEYLDSLDDFDGSTFIESLPPAGGAGYHDPSRVHHWDKRVRGAGAPPLKTDMGWLLLYHANDQRDPGKYKLGAMLLDLEDPTKILYRSNAPILGPEEWYENDGKPGVVYTCGAVILDGNLVVYYGGGDKHIAVARANAKQFVEGLIHNHNPTLTKITTTQMDVN